MNEPMHPPPQRDRARLAAALVALWAAPAMARDAASAYPTRPIRIVVGFTPGGPADQVAREVGQRLQDAWGQPVIVENRPGAGSRIAFEQVARAAPDGYTLLLGAVQTATHMAVYRKLNFDTLRDFAPVTQLTSAVLALTVSPSGKAQSVADLVALARARPDELSYASFGIASSAHFAGALFEQRAGLRLTHVPYPGATQAQTAIAGGQVDLGFMSALSAMPLMQAGKLRPLAVTSEQRLAQLPGVPTMAEAGFPAFEVSSWQGLLAPAGTPPAIVAKLQREIARILALPEVRQRFAAVAAEPVASTPAQFRAHIESEIARWSAVARQAGVSLD
jgi:tripartite-type tricarboxylate transporter receptor subunit TctC